MPSHVAHLVFAEQVRDSLPPPLQAALSNRQYCYLALGAQGPDIFYHNRRRKPSGLEYGTRLHRYGYGSAVAGMLQRLLGMEEEARELALYLFGFLTHAFLDRAAHPYINYTAGWYDPADSKSAGRRGAHAYLERLIDVEVLRRFRNCGFEQYNFFARVDAGERPPPQLVRLIAAGLRQAVPRAAADQHLLTRIEHAYLDARGFYSYTNRTLEQFLAEELPEQSSLELRRCALLHPARVPHTLDPANESRRPWLHPCSSEPTYTSTLWELMEDARRAAEPAARYALELIQAKAPPEAAHGIVTLVGELNLSDGRPGTRPCPKRFSRPLPLMEHLREQVSAATSGRILSRLPD